MIATALALVGMLTATGACAQSKAVIDTNVASTLAHFIALDSRHEALLRRAVGVLIFPTLVKGGIGLATAYGAGALQTDGATEGYYSLASASVGLTAGMETHSEIILFMTRNALDKFLKSKGWAVGADTGVTVMEKSTAADYESVTLGKPVLRFVFDEEGLMADISVSGGKINRLAR